MVVLGYKWLNISVDYLWGPCCVSPSPVLSPSLPHPGLEDKAGSSLCSLSKYWFFSPPPLISFLLSLLCRS